MSTKETPIKVSVFLSPELHRAAKLAAMDAKVSLSQWIAAMVTKKLARQKAA